MRMSEDHRSLAEVQEDAAAISGMFSLLSRIWLREIDVEFCQRLEDSDFRLSFESVGGVVPETSELEDLATEYCRLFVGPKNHLLPLQSVWVQGTLQSEVTSSARAFAEALQMDLSGSEVSMPDHLGVLFAIAARAYSVLAEVEPEPTEQSDSIVELIAEFRNRHLLWVSPLLSAVEERGGDFYGSVARMTTTFLKQISDLS